MDKHRWDANAGFVYHGLQAPAPAPSPSSIPSSLPGSLTLSDLDGRAVLVAHDGTYLGKVSSSTSDADSIYTSWGQYGSTWGERSVRTDWGQYGSNWSSLSAYNNWTTTPPAIVLDQHAVGYLTKNTALHGAVDPDAVLAAYGCANH